MGTLSVDNIEERSTGKSQNSLSGQAKAWSSFDGEGVLPEYSSFNVAGYVDNGVGDYTVTISADMSDTNYCVNCLLNGEGAGAVMAPYYNPRASAAGSYRMSTRRCDNSNFADTGDVNYSFFGDLA